MAKKAKNDQLLIKINKEVKKEFLRLCEKDDTTASREVRRFIEKYIEGFIED
jgi:predicted DNA-binding protein